MDVTGVAASSALQNGGTITQAGQQNTLTINDFFTLMAAQLQYQDPTSPTDTSQYLGQLAQYGMLQQMTSMTDMMQFVKASGVVGKTVAYSVYDDTTGKTTTGSGVVEEVDLSSSSPSCLIGSGWVPLSDVTAIAADSVSTASAASGTASNAASGTASDAAASAVNSAGSLSALAQELSNASQSSALSALSSDDGSSLF